MIYAIILFIALGIIFVISAIKYVQAYGDLKYTKGRLDEAEYQLIQWDKLAEDCVQDIKDRIKWLLRYYKYYSNCLFMGFTCFIYNISFYR